jgi:hypothetical protein
MPASVPFVRRMTKPAPIGGEVMRLGQFVKFAGLLDSGGTVKEAIIDGYVIANGVPLNGDVAASRNEPPLADGQVNYRLVGVA